MSPLRLSASRVVAPLQAPRIEGARQLNPATPQIIAFPDAQSLSPAPEHAFEVVVCTLPATPILEIRFGNLAQPPIDPVAASLGAPDVPGDLFSTLKPAPIAGHAFHLPISESDEQVGLQTGLKGNGQGERVADWLDLLLPVLYPPPQYIEDDPRATLPAYVLQGAHALIERPSLLLADDPGLDKTVIASLALGELFQRRRISRALLVSSAGRVESFQRDLIRWAPFLRLERVAGRARQRKESWKKPAHVYLTDYRSLAEELEGQDFQRTETAFDLVVLDTLQALRREASRVTEAIHKLSAPRRWALAGGPPRDPDDWLAVFSFLAPEESRRQSNQGLPDIQRQFRSYVFRRSKAQLAAQLPRLHRKLVWLNLDSGERQVYQSALRQEQSRLERLGHALSRTHVSAAVDRLKKLCNFAADSLDSSKIRTLIDLVEEIVAARAKLIVFSHFEGQNRSGLQQVLEAYGIEQLDSETLPPEVERRLARFRDDPECHILLADVRARGDRKPLPKVSYVIHFDHGWNPALRRRAEARFFPQFKREIPLTIYEFWVRDTIDANIYALLAERRMLSDDLKQDTRPAELEDRLSLADWLGRVFEIESQDGDSRTTLKLERAALEVGSDGEHDLAFQTALERLFTALGYPQTLWIEGPDLDGARLIARDEAGMRSVYVHCVRGQDNIGVKAGRDVLAQLEMETQCDQAYLVTTSDFTPACKKIADDSDGRLALISGDEFSRHLHILGWSNDQIPWSASALS